MEAARQILGRARWVTVLTGAGISTDSGIPDFRGPNGVWTKDPAAERTSSLSDYLADGEVRRKAWHNRLDSPAWSASPNAGHMALVRLERQGRLRALVTQNIDGLHQRAGSNPALVLELHGSLFGAVCWDCGARTSMAEQLERVRSGDPDPHCERCGGILKSTTISFGQSLDAALVRRARQAASECELLLVVGSSLSVHPAAGLVPLAKRNGASVVIVNGEAGAYDHLADAIVRAPISEALPQLVASLPSAAVDDV